VLFNIDKVFYSVTTQHQYTVNNTQFWLHDSVSSKHNQANIYYMNVHSVCTFITVHPMGSYIKCVLLLLSTLWEGTLNVYFYYCPPYGKVH